MDDRLRQAAREAFAVGERLDWKSHDPFDLLLSPYVARLTAPSSLAARVAVRLGRRAGIRTRRFLHVERHEEAKALADFLRAGTLLAAAGEEWAAERVLGLSTRLQRLAATHSSGHGWGLGFPYVSRYGRCPRGAPNAYTTTAVCEALLDEHDLTGAAEPLAAAFSGGRFLLEGLGTFPHRGSRWLPYWPGSRAPIVNIQASAAALFARLARYEAGGRMVEPADHAAAAAICVQRADGAWPYGDDDRGRFVDGFHTGFTLQGLQEYAERRADGAVEGVAGAVERGFAYFKRHLLSANELPLDFADGRVSRDGQNAAQCVQTLLVCGDPADVRAALGIWTSILAPLLLGGHASSTEAVSLRWDLGPAALATAHLVRAVA